MKSWETNYPTRRQRLLNEVRKFQYESITTESSFVRVEKVKQSIESISKRLPEK